MICLFVTGPADGKWMQIEKPDEPHQVYYPDPLPRREAFNPNQEALTVTLNHVTYFPFKLGGELQRWTVYAPRGTKMDDILKQMILNYHPLERSMV